MAESRQHGESAGQSGSAGQQGESEEEEVSDRRSEPSGPSFTFLLEAARRLREGIAVFTPDVSTTEPRILFANPAFRALLGSREEVDVGRRDGREGREGKEGSWSQETLASLLGSTRGAWALSRLRDSLAEGRPVTQVTNSRLWQGERGNRLVEWEAFVPSEPGDDAGHVVAVVRDVTDSHLAGRALRIPGHDPATGLPDRSHFIDRVGRAVELVKKSTVFTYAVISIRIDTLDEIRNRFGELVSTGLIEAVAWRLRQLLRLSDLVARTESDEIAVLVEHAGEPHHLEVIVQRMIETLWGDYFLGGQKLTVEGRLGIAMGQSDYESPADVLAAARRVATRRTPTDEVGVGTADPELYRSSVKLAHLARALEDGIERGELAILYQPAYSLKTDRLVGLEALLRWNHPERGMLPPGEFLPAARMEGLLVPIGIWVVEAVCAQVSTWRAAFAKEAVPPVSINLSGPELSDPRLLEAIERSLKSRNLPPEAIRIEISEAALARTPPDEFVRTMDELNEMGVRPWLDDFGSAGISLHMLQRLSLGGVKVQTMPEIGQSGENGTGRTVAAMIELAVSLGLEPGANRVETDEQVKALASWSCEFAQGHLYSEPITPELVDGLLSN